MKTIAFDVEGMHCNGCALGLEGALEQFDFVGTAQVSFPEKTATLQVYGDEYDLSALQAAADKLGFSIKPQ